MREVDKKERWRVTFFLAGILFSVEILIVVILYYVYKKLFQIDIISVYNRTQISPNVLFTILIIYIVIICYGFAFLLGKIITVPINKVINAMEQLAKGNYKQRLVFKKPFSETSVFIDLCDCFNKMADELDHTETLSSDFINNFSHEFKTPIVSISGFAKLLNKGNLPEERQKEYLKIIEDESERLSKLAINAMQMMKIENLSILTDVKHYNLSEQIRNCFLLLENKWACKDFDIQFNFDEFEISANENLLKHLWINLLDNAVKFTPKGGTIKVDIRHRESNLVITVMNNGSSISPEAQKHIFNKFYQADESHSSEGFGIGLGVAKKIVELHKGNICVTSGNNKTVFVVTLPE